MTKIAKLKACEMVARATVHLEHHEYVEAGDDVDRLCVAANTTDTAGRIEIAAAGYKYGSKSLRGSRVFDNCFENGDSDLVVAALTRRADDDRELYNAIAEDFGGTFPQRWIDKAASLGL